MTAQITPIRPRPRHYDVWTYVDQRWAHQGEVLIPPNATREEVEEHLSRLGVYAPRGLDELRWAEHGAGAVILEQGKPIVKIMPATQTTNPPHRSAGKMAALCRSFPSLAAMPGVDPWRPEVFARRVSTMSSGEAHAARFVLGVWAGGRYGHIASFDLFEAFRVWDEKHRAAVVAFCKEPFWP